MGKEEKGDEKEEKVAEGMKRERKWKKGGGRCWKDISTRGLGEAKKEAMPDASERGGREDTKKKKKVLMRYF